MHGAGRRAKGGGPRGGAEGKGVGAGERDGRAVSAVLGALLMLAVLMTLVPGMILMRDAISDEMEAQRAAAERAAWCARNPAIGPPTCEDDGPLPGYDCREVELHAWLCTPADTRPKSEPTPVLTPSPPSAVPTIV